MEQQDESSDGYRCDPEIMIDPGAIPMKPMSVAQVASEGIAAIQANKAVCAPGRTQSFHESLRAVFHYPQHGGQATREIRLGRKKSPYAE
jgi:hypothetical protein